MDGISGQYVDKFVGPYIASDKSRPSLAQLPPCLRRACKKNGPFPGVPVLGIGA